MAKINMKPIVEFAGQICEVAVYGLMVGAIYKVFDHVVDYDTKPVGYDDAVGAIMKSGMWSHDKSEAVVALKQYGLPDYYKAIVNIAKNDDMFSHDKVDMIKKLSE